MADPLRITVGSPTADVNPFADVVPSGNLFADPIEIDPRARDLVIRTVFGEDAARDEPSRAAIANVIRNRIASGKYGQGAEGVIRKPWAFEPWMNPKARQRMLDLREDDPNYQSIAQIVDNVLSGNVKDITQGATHFYAPRAQAALGRNAPAWGRGQPLADIGGHLFYAPEGPVRGTPSSPAPDRGGAAAPVSPAPPSIQPADRVMLASLATNKVSDGNPFVDTAPPVTAPTPTPKQPLPPQMQTGDVGQGTAFATGVEQGLTFGFGDELRGIEAGLGASIPGGAGERIMAAINIAKQAWGNYQANPNDAAMAAYKKAVEDARKLYAQSKQQYPGTTLGGEFVGGAAVPLPGGGPLLSGGRTVASRVGTSAAQGALGGGLTGLGTAEGDVSQRVGPALTGAVGGTVVGAGVGAIGPAIANYIGRAIYGLAAPKRQAEAQLARTATQAAGTPERVLPHQMTPDTVVADVLGEPGRVLARGVKNIDPGAGAILQEPLEQRAAGQYRRLLDWMEGKFGPLGDNEMAKLAVRAEQAQVTTPLYQGVMQQFPNGVMPPRLVALIDQHPTLKSAAEDALRTIRENAAVAQRPAPGVDSLEFWDQVKRNIQGKIDFAVTTPGTGSSGEQRSLKELQRVIINELDNVTGGPQGPYAQARAASEAYFNIGGAIKEGQRFIKSNQFTTPQAENAFRGMSPDAQEAFRKAALSQLLDKFGTVKDSHNLWKGLNSSPDAQAKLKFLFNNDQKAIQEFEAMHHVERIQERLREAVRGNSTTTQQLIAAGTLTGGGGVASFMSGNYDPTTAGGAALWGGAALAARKGANYRMAEHLANMLVSKDPELIQKAVSAAAGDVRMMNVLRTMTENMLARTGGAAVGRSIGD